MLKIAYRTKALAFISKHGYKVLVSPAFLKAEIYALLKQAIPKAVGRAAAKNIPVWEHLLERDSLCGV